MPDALRGKSRYLGGCAAIMLAAMRRSYAVQAAAPLRRLQQPRVAAAMRTVHTTAPLQTNPDTFPVRGALSPGALSPVPSDALPVPLRPASHTAAAQTGTLQYVPAAMIDEVLPIVIDDDYVLCNGGDDTLVGHPIEMIKVDSPWPAVCKYCGLRYINTDMAAKNAEWAFLVGVRMRSFFSKCWPKSACQPPPMRSSLVWRCPRCRRTRQACRCTRALRRTALASRAAGS
jgi:uncharacterized Zn-finger protein